MITPVPAAGFAADAMSRAASFPLHISPSEAKAYLECPLRFRFEQVSLVARPVARDLHLGRAVRAALEAFHLGRWLDGDDSPQAIAGEFEKTFLLVEEREGVETYENPSEREKSRLEGLRIVAAYLDSPEAPREKPERVGMMSTEEIPGLSVPLNAAADLIQADLVPVDFMVVSSERQIEAAAFDHEIQWVSHQLLMEAATGRRPPSLDLVLLVRSNVPRVIRIKSPAADLQRKRRVTALLETVVIGIVEGRFHPQPGTHCAGCPFRCECGEWPQTERRAA